MQLKCIQKNNPYIHTYKDHLVRKKIQKLILYSTTFDSKYKDMCNPKKKHHFFFNRVILHTYTTKQNPQDDQPPLGVCRSSTAFMSLISQPSFPTFIQQQFPMSRINLIIPTPTTMTTKKSITTSNTFINLIPFIHFFNST